MLYQTSPKHRRLFDQWDGKVPPPRLPTTEEKARVNACEHRVCRDGCQLTQCRLGKGKRWGSEVFGEVDTFDCLECLGLRK